MPIFGQNECRANAEENGFDFIVGTICAGGDKQGSCYVSNMLKDIYESQILPRATVEELWQWKMVFLPVLSVGEDLSSVERWARISKRLIFIIIDFHLDACCRRMYLTSTLMLLPMWSGSMKRFWVWVACSPVATRWRKYLQKVSSQSIDTLHQNIFLFNHFLDIFSNQWACGEIFIYMLYTYNQILRLLVVSISPNKQNLNNSGVCVSYYYS